MRFIIVFTLGLIAPYLGVELGSSFPVTYVIAVLFDLVDLVIKISLVGGKIK